MWKDFKHSFRIYDEYCTLIRNKVFYIPYFIKGYPEKLKHISNAPKGLFVKNKLPDEDKLTVAIVGARKCSRYGEIVAHDLAEILARNDIQVISGMAKGIDGIAQQSAVDSNGRVFAVLGSGVDICYPIENQEIYRKLIKQENCGVLSEYIIGTKPNAKLFPARNRIISGWEEQVLLLKMRLLQKL